MGVAAKEAWSVSPSALTRGQTVHSSPTSEVYLTTLRTDPASPPLVLKRTKITCSADIARFEKEQALLRRCAHPQVAKLLGIVKVPPTYALLLPQYSRGALFSLLHVCGRQLLPSAAVQICAEVADAVAFLHTLGVVHRDIKSDNVLVDEAGHAVLADFNAAELEEAITPDIMVQARPTGGFFKQFVVGTLPYMAPELLRSVRGAAYSRACDVYSLAIVINEVATQRVPYADSLTENVQLHTILEARYNHDSLTAAITSNGLRPPHPEVGSPLHDLCDLTTRAWADAPNDRPSAAEVCAELTAMLSERWGSSGFDAAADEHRTENGRGPANTETPPRHRILFGPDDPDSNNGTASYGSGSKPSFIKSGYVDSAATASTAISSAVGFGASTPEAGGAPSLPCLAATLGVAGLSPRRSAAEATAGRRGLDRMEDRHVLRAAGGFSVAAVFDGHNGDGAAAYCADQLVPALCRTWRADAPHTAAAAASALTNTFAWLNTSFLASYPKDESGCTALTVVCLPDALVIANAGDCQCKLWRGASLLTLNTEHTAQNSVERARVVAEGATISTTADGKQRLGGVIQVTRCIGDRSLRHLGLSAEPEVHHVGIEPEDRLLILASDGLWDVMPDERVLHCLRNTAQSPDLLAKRLIFDAMERGTNDNVTVVVVMLQDC